MPRDLLADRDARDTLDQMAPLSKEPLASSPPLDQPMSLYGMTAPRVDDRFKRLKDLRPYALLLNQDDLDDCDWLEHAAFDPDEAASREKIAYRLTTAGPLCTGLFTSAYATSPFPLPSLLKAHSFPTLDSTDTDRKRLLLGHILATRSPSPLVTHASMGVPSDWRSNYQLAPSEGHDEEGATVCLHSLGVHPDLHNRGLAGLLLRSWCQRIKSGGVGVRRIALICRERLVKFYESAGFRRVGLSECKVGEGSWVDMVMDIDGDGDEDGDD